MRREYATFQSLARFFNYVSSDGEKKVVFVCSSRTTFVEDAAEFTISSHPPTLNQLATAGKVALYFVPTIAHLCAALSTGESFGVLKEGPKETRTVILLNVMALHSTGGSQRLSQTIALAVDATGSAGVNLLLAQYAIPDQERLEENDCRLASKGWNEQLSVLGSRSTLPSTRQPWAARTVTAEQVVSRWCTRVEPGNGSSLFRG